MSIERVLGRQAADAEHVGDAPLVPWAVPEVVDDAAAPVRESNEVLRYGCSVGDALVT